MKASLNAAVNTLRANKLTLFLAKYFGIKWIHITRKGEVINMRTWRGKNYIIGFNK